MLKTDPQKNDQKIVFSFKAVFQARKPSENEGPGRPKIDHKSHLILEKPKLKNKQTLPHFSSFFLVPKPSKIVTKRG